MKLNSCPLLVGHTCHEGVVIGIGQAWKIWSHIIHPDTVFHDLPKSRQFLQIVHVVIAESINEKHQKFVSRVAGLWKSEYDDDYCTRNRGEFCHDEWSSYEIAPLRAHLLLIRWSLEHFALRRRLDERPMHGVRGPRGDAVQPCSVWLKVSIFLSRIIQSDLSK